MFEFFRAVKYSVHPARIEGRARRLVMFGAKKAFYFFQQTDVRRWLDFDRKDQVEQDRFFNEMVVTNIIMLMLILDEKIALAEGQKREHFLALRAEAPEAYGRILERSGVEDEHIRTWRQLIDMRYDEYSESKLEWRRLIAEHNDEIGHDNEISLFQALAFGLYDHLRRGRIKKDDPLYKRIQSFLAVVYMEMRKLCN